MQRPESQTGISTVVLIGLNTEYFEALQIAAHAVGAKAVFLEPNVFLESGIFLDTTASTENFSSPKLLLLDTTSFPADALAGLRKKYDKTPIVCLAATNPSFWLNQGAHSCLGQNIDWTNVLEYWLRVNAN